MKYVLYEVSDEYDVIIKFTFASENYMTEFIQSHTADKKYTPRFLVFELDENNDIDFIFEYLGTELIKRRCLAEYIEQRYN